MTRRTYVLAAVLVLAASLFAYVERPSLHHPSGFLSRYGGYVMVFYTSENAGRIFYASWHPPLKIQVLAMRDTTRAELRAMIDAVFARVAARRAAAAAQTSALDAQRVAPTVERR